MTAREVINRAVDLLGYSTINGNTQIMPRIMNRAVSIVNVVYEDLWGIAADNAENPPAASGPPPFRARGAEFEPIKVLTDEVKLTGRALGIMPYGVAAFIAQSESDGDQQQVWMSVYNKKRRTMSHGYTRVDVIPK